MEEIRDKRKSGDFAPFTKEDPLYAKSKEKLRLVTDAFTEILYARDDLFMDNMKEHNLAGDDISRYLNWEWPQGVGLYGIWKLYLERGGIDLQLLGIGIDGHIGFNEPDSAFELGTTVLICLRARSRQTPASLRTRTKYLVRPIPWGSKPSCRRIRS